jgi:hypothetical protein
LKQFKARGIAGNEDGPHCHPAGTAKMTRTTTRRIAWTLAAGSVLALGAAIAAIGASGHPSARAAGPSLFDTLTLMRWGQGALDWTLPDPTGDRHARTRHHHA